jgi:hypothetical protein
MHVYVFGDDKDNCIELANRLNGNGISTIIGKVQDIQTVSAKIGKEFDYAIMVSDNPIDAAANANKVPRIKAAACYNQKILRNAINTKVNLFVVDQESLDSINLEGVLAEGKTAIQQPEQQKRDLVAQPKIIKKPQKRQEEDEDVDEEDSQEPRSGIRGKLKDIFGIE